MKKIVLCLFVIMSIIEATAQVRITTVDPDFKVVLKRSVLAAKDVYVDMMIENLSSDDSIIDLRPVDTKVYDDEGNVYSGHGKVYWEFKGQDLPANVPLKCRLIVRNIDPLASVLKKIVIGSYDTYSKIKVSGTTLINVPINKE